MPLQTIDIGEDFLTYMTGDLLSISLQHKEKKEWRSSFSSRVWRYTLSMVLEMHWPSGTDSLLPRGFGEWTSEQRRRSSFQSPSFRFPGGETRKTDRTKQGQTKLTLLFRQRSEYQSAPDWYVPEAEILILQLSTPTFFFVRLARRESRPTLTRFIIVGQKSGQYFFVE